MPDGFVIVMMTEGQDDKPAVIPGADTYDDQAEAETVLARANNRAGLRSTRPGIRYRVASLTLLDARPGT